MNVCGLKSKLRFEEFHDIIKCYDIFICIETRIDKFDILKLPDGYSEFTKCRKHFKKKSSGITVIFKNVFKKCLNFIETDSGFVLWFRINSFSENHNLLCGCIYIPPENSKYSSSRKCHFIVFGLKPRSTTLEVSMLIITPLMRFFMYYKGWYNVVYILYLKGTS